MRPSLIPELMEMPSHLVDIIIETSLFCWDKALHHNNQTVDISILWPNNKLDQDHTIEILV